MQSSLSFFVLASFALFPFFEGCQSAIGLLLVHTLTLAALVLCFLRSPRIWLPPLALFIPFLLYLIISCVVAPYRYSALLRLWEWWAAALLTLAWTTLMKEGESALKQLGLRAFLVGAAAMILSVVAGWNSPEPRWNGTFANPNDFGAYAALLLLFGIFQLERVASSTEKSLVWVALAILAVCVAMAASRSVFLAISTVTILHLYQRKPPRWVIASVTGFLAISGVILYFRLLHADPFQYYWFRIWKYSLLGILRDPYFGVGLNMLPWKAAQFNFPADVDVGRYARIAASADNQYLQILAETGFLGLFLFALGWLGVHFLLKQIPDRLSLLRYSSFIMISIISVFSLPLENTAIVGLFLFLVLFPVIASEIPMRSITLKPSLRIAGVIVFCAAFVFAVLLPFAAEWEMRLARKPESPEQAYAHLKRASELNPFQPYYIFARIEPLILSNPALSEDQWLRVIHALDTCIRLNPLEPNFYIYEAKVYRILYQNTRKELYFRQAVEMYERAQQQSPYQVFQRAELAYYLFSAGRYDHAAKELEEILELEPAYLNARLLLAEVKLRQGDPQGARLELQQVEEMEKRYAPSSSKGTNYVQRLLQLSVEQKNELLKSLQ